VDKSTQGQGRPSCHYTNISLTANDRDAGVVNAGAPRQRAPHACVLLLLLQACSTERKEVCMPRTPAVGNDGVLGVRRDCARLRATAHLKTPAGRSSLSLFLVPVPAGRPVGGGEEQRKDVAVPVLCFVSSAHCFL
jgi:hypothetical protein